MCSLTLNYILGVIGHHLRDAVIIVLHLKCRSSSFLMILTFNHIVFGLNTSSLSLN